MLKKEMLSITKHKMNLCREPFDMIASGEKTIELRLYDEKRQLVKVGDTIIFTDLENTDKKIITEVISVNVFKSFAELYENLPVLKCGYRPGEIADPDDMLKYYSRKQEEKYGAVGIEVRKIAY